MADEPRRSVRATKGQHTKSLDLLDQPEPMAKKKSTKKTKKVVEKEEEVEVIRCVCGALETGDDDGEPWIACDNCGVWQHNVCVGVPIYDEDTPENYLCEECDPAAHKDLLDALKRGAKLWDERREVYDRKKAEEEGAQKKKGKKKGKRVSEVANTSNGKAKSPSVSVEKSPAAKAVSAKRTREDSHDKVLKEPQPKVRKVSAAHVTPRQESPLSTLPAKVADIEGSRQGPAKAVSKSLQHAIPIAIKRGVYTLGESDTVEAKAERLAIQVEDAIFTTHPDKAAYTNQTRSITFNLKKNQELCDGLLARSLTPLALASMTSDDMATKELKREKAEMEAQNVKQSIMISEEGPRVRRTHKGEELVEGDNFNVADDTISTSRRRSMLDPNATMATRSRENSPGDQVELPADIDSYRSRDDIRGNTIPKALPNIDTKTPQMPLRKASGQPDFDINKVYANLPSQSPISAQHVRKPSLSQTPRENGPGDDPDIDRLLEDDDGNDSPPYSPAEYNSDPDIIWRGSVVMDSVARFPGTAKHVAGFDISQNIPWSGIVEKELKIAGRIAPDAANEYLCSLRWNSGTDLTVINVTPSGESATEGLRALYNYFLGKGKYGVFTNKGIGNVRDTYLIPIKPSPSSLPDFINNLEDHKVPTVRSEPMLLIALVIRDDVHLPEAARILDGASDIQSPSVSNHPQRQMSMAGTGPAMSPIGPPGQAPLCTPTPVTPAEDQQMKQREGEQTAMRILGPHINDSTVAFLMPQAFQMRPLEWEIIARILQEDVKARTDLQHLGQQIEARMSSQKS